MKSVSRLFPTLVAMLFVVTSAQASLNAMNPPGPTCLKTVDEDSYRITISHNTLAVNTPGHFRVTVIAKGGFKVNENYPHKLTLDTPAKPISLPKTHWKKRDVQFKGTQQFFYKIPVTASKAGTYPIVGKIQLSVCTANTCVIKKKTLSFPIKAIPKQSK